MALRSETRLGPYEIVSAIGAGGMGEVYRARDPRLGRDVAIKILPASFSSDPFRLQRFGQEARAAAALNHPNILAVYDIGTQDGSPYIVSELLDGATLRDRLRSGALSVRKAIDYAQQIARGLAAAHDKGIVHRDLKPENIFITTDGRVKILDFGLAKLTLSEPAADDQTLTQAAASDPGTVLGTVGYMSPEQVRGKPADARCDLFSLGAILFEMLSGKRAFHGESPAETMSAIAKEEPPELTETNRAVPPVLERIVRHCLEKNPLERFQSARDVAFDLESVSGTSQTSAGVQRMASGFAWRKLTPLLLIVALFAGGAAGVLIGRRGAHNPTDFRAMSYEHGAIPAARFLGDGRSLIYDASWEGRPLRIFSTPNESPQPHALEFEQAHLFSVSKAGELAIGLRGRLGNHLDYRYSTLGIAPMGGGAPREVLDNVAEADWGPDGNLAVVHTVNGHDRIEYPVGHVLYETSGWVTHIRFSHKGDRIAFLDHPVYPDDRGWVAVVDLNGQKRTLTEEYESVVGLAWSPKNELWFTATEGVQYRSLRAVTLAGKARVVLAVPGVLRLHDIADDGRVLLAMETERVGIKAYSAGQKAERDLSWSGWTLANDISPDGKWLLFDEEGVVVAGTNYVVGLRTLEGSPPVRLTQGSSAHFSRDGKWVYAAPLGAPRTILVPTGVGAEKELPLPVERRGWTLPSLDDKHLLLTGAEKGHAFRCYAQDVETGRIEPVSPEGVAGTIPCIPSPDGSSVAVTQADHGIVIYSLRGKPPAAIPGDTSRFELIRWCADGGLYAYRNELPLRIVRIDPATGSQKVVRELAPTDAAGLIGISPVVFSPDAKAYAYSYRRTLSELYLVQGLK